MSPFYTVQYGDSLSTIAQQNGTTPQALIRENQMYSPRIYVGQQLRIPSFARQL